MRKYLIALASALLLAALVTEITDRFWADNYLALLVITGIALFINGLFNANLASGATAAATAPARQTRQGKSNQNQASKKGQEPRNRSRNRDQQNRDQKRRDQNTTQRQQL